jgi:serine/threonine protein kinase/Tol biopolymer transport system component
MTLVPGTRLGPYEVLGPLGAGGMGEVYRAKDTRLGRDVAIKILPKEMSADLARKQRFEREAKTISGLNHPNICVLHDVGSQDGVDYLVMECVEGETLAKRLEKGPLPLEQVFRYGAQIADALDKAHRAGIVHRDLKPGNIMLTATGAKLLDFGLAKPAAAVISGATLTAAEPMQAPVTQEGTIVGTFQYMSPEQIEGKEVDGRSDIFSLGAVLYEMVTGKRAFEGKSQLSVASAILEREPAAVSAVKPMTPPALDHAIKKSLAKSAEERWQSASDLASELKWIPESGQAVSSAVRGGKEKTRERGAWLIAGVLVGAIAVGAVWWPSSKSPEQSMYFPAPMSVPARDIAVAPNGRSIAVVAYLESARKNALWIYELGSPSARSVPDSVGATYPFWSADGRSLAFFADGKLKKLDVSGGQVQTLCDAPSGRGGAWNKDGVIVFTPEATLGPGRGLYRVSASGGAPVRISDPDTNRGEQSHRWPMFLPDGKHYLYMAANFAGQKGVNAIFVGSLDSNEKRFVVEASGNAAYAAPGYLLFPREKTLLAQQFDLKRFALTGEATAILTDIQYQPQVRRAVFAVSDNGLLIAQTGSGVALSQPVWFDRKGKEGGAVGKPEVYGNVSIAPSGRSVAVDITDMASLNTDVWTYELERDSAKRLTFDPAFDVVPIWSPDASRLVFASNRRLNVDVYLKNSDGAQEEKVMVQDEFNKLPSDWFKDGKYILYTRGADLWFLTLPELKSSLFLKAVSTLRNGQFSPDGKWVSYASNETGKWQIYVTSFPDAHGKWQVSTSGGEQPRWRADGKELFYLSSDSKIMAVPVTTGINFDNGRPAELFQTNPRQPVSTNDQFVYDVSRDGQRFLILTQVKQAETQPMSVILNWTAKLN